MTVGETYQLSVDAPSGRCIKGIPILYGTKGTKVTIIAFSDPAVIVEDGKGERYSVHKDKLKKPL